MGPGRHTLRWPEKAPNEALEFPLLLLIVSEDPNAPFPALLLKQSTLVTLLHSSSPHLNNPLTSCWYWYIASRPKALLPLHRTLILPRRERNSFGQASQGCPVREDTYDGGVYPPITILFETPAVP